MNSSDGDKNEMQEEITTATPPAADVADCTTMTPSSSYHTAVSELAAAGSVPPSETADKDANNRLKAWQRANLISSSGSDLPGIRGGSFGWC